MQTYALGSEVSGEFEVAPILGKYWITGIIMVGVRVVYDINGCDEVPHARLTLVAEPTAESMAIVAAIETFGDELFDLEELEMSEFETVVIPQALAVLVRDGQFIHLDYGQQNPLDPDHDLDLDLVEKEEA
jgi:hypothetical protein